MKKKLLALALSAVMMMGLSTTAFAATTVTPTTETTVTASISKMYTATNADTTSPADTFKFTVENYSVTDAADGVTVSNMPTPSITDITVESGDATTSGTSHNLSISLPSYTSVGVYTYKITETDNDLAGVTYSTTDYYLVVTVTQNEGVLSVSSYYLHSGTVNGVKTDDIDNTYSAGSLEVSKYVTGNLGVKDKDFDVTVTFTAPTGKTVKSTISYTVGTETLTIAPDDWTNGVATVKISLSDEETIKFENIPYGVTYTVVEDDYTDDGYEASYNFSDDSKEIDTASDSVTITNDKTGDVDTGINLDSLPYVMILCLVLLGATYVISRRRLSDRY